ncbi:zinc-binding dehydrogenase [Ornithinimicrobium faecis]|uniref:zinc-binding dehydrogenase n=1 Tax=Ornithinimicrobium faecis TaxID=2934158 RepID=UPI002118A941|nr:zinc-binding dehydrogenase [Ornithinimicrobium sp. HY1745]
MLRQVRFAPTLREASEIVTEPLSSPGPGQVLVRQHYAGVNGLFDNVLARGEVPYVPRTDQRDLGVEAVGVVQEIGPSVEHLSVGAAVAGSRLGYGYREWLIADATELVPVPAADPRYVALRTSAVSALIALEQAGRMGQNETVVITAAAGGLGQFLVQFAQRAGNTVIGVCGGPQKVELLRRLGCDRPVDHRSEDLGAVLDREFGGQVALAVDTVGGELFDALVSRLAPRGRLVTAGHASDIGPEGARPVQSARVYQHLYWTSASVIGFQNALYADLHAEAFARVLRWDAEGLLEVATDPTPFTGLEAIPDAVDHLTGGHSVGKVVVDLRPDPSHPIPTPSGEH